MDEAVDVIDGIAGNGERYGVFLNIEDGLVEVLLGGGEGT